MGAEVDKAGKAFFVLDKPGLNLGAVAAGLSNFTRDRSRGRRQPVQAKGSETYNWLVCPHLSEADLVYDYCMASGLITLVLGKCFCETCYDNILNTGDLAELLDSGRPMTDRQFAADLITPIIASNGDSARPLDGVRLNHAFHFRFLSSDARILPHTGMSSHRRLSNSRIPNHSLLSCQLRLNSNPAACATSMNSARPYL